VTKKTRIFRFRLDDAEQERLQRETDERGLSSKADRIREALGWGPLAARALPPSPQTREVIRRPEGPAADPEEEIGMAAIEELAKRIHGGEGVPMRVATQRAKERLSNGGRDHG